jgi:hypothetical protein
MMYPLNLKILSLFSSGVSSNGQLKQNEYRWIPAYAGMTPLGWQAVSSQDVLSFELVWSIKSWLPRLTHNKRGI